MSQLAGSQTRGFLFADLRDYTRFAEAHGDQAAAELLARYRSLVREVIARFDGAEIRTEGDSFYVVFSSASGAVNGGLAIFEAAATGNPRWSPDGSSIVFQRGVANDLDGLPELYIVGSDGAGARLLFHGSGPMWSPDGRFVAATRCCESGHAEAWIIPVDALDPSEARMLGVGVAVAWTPDGSAVVIAPSGDDADVAWRLIDPSGYEVGRLEIDGGFIEWSPDGQQVLITRPEMSGATGVYRAALDGTDEHLVLALPLLSSEARALGWQPRLVPIADGVMRLRRTTVTSERAAAS